ncbi:MAG TPA: cytochrome c biogenesis protein CcsA [Fimbriimonadaceae bacterium]|nr:cytochrome c biogenesis protein CcsA [Fimbriimonadaceae bacterium]
MLTRGLFALAVAGGTVASFLAPDATAFPSPELARIIFFHLPCAFIATIFLLLSGWHSVAYLVKDTDRTMRDLKAVAAQEIAMLMSLLTMATGILFSKVQWQAWWNWDPRQTSFLLVLLILAAYFALRTAIRDDQRRAVASAVYGTAGLLPIMFLIFVYPRLPNRFSLHPSNTIVSGGFDRTYWGILLYLFVLLLGLSIHLFRLRLRAGWLLYQAETNYGSNETRDGGSAPTGVVRPVRLPGEN